MTITAILPVQARSDRRLIDRFRAVRDQTVNLCSPLQVEDFVVSTMPDVSPTKWHLAHPSWFSSLCSPITCRMSSPTRYAFLFNSYYVQAGERHCRAQRPGHSALGREVFGTRYVDDAMLRLCERIADDPAHPRGQSSNSASITNNSTRNCCHRYQARFWMNLRPTYRAETGRRLNDGLDWRADAGVVRLGTPDRDSRSTTRGRLIESSPSHSGSQHAW
jgi:hypothetical protein